MHQTVDLGKDEPPWRDEHLWPFVASAGALLLVLAGRAVDASGAGGGGAAPDALVGAGAVAVLARRRVDAGGAVVRRAAPFAVLLVVAVLVLPRRRMYASRAIGRTAAVSAFRAHVDSFLDG